MTRFTALISAAMAATFAMPGFADVTPQQVWDNLSGSLERVGMSVVVADQTQSGDTLVVDGLSLVFQIGPSRSVSEIEQLRLVGQGDGTVAIEIEPAIRLTTQTRIDDELLAQNTGLVTFSGLGMIASGEAGRIVYDMGADQVVSETKVAATDLTPMAQLSTMTLSGFTSQAIAEMQGQDMHLQTTGSAESYAANMATEAPEGAADLRVDFTGSDFSFESTAVLPPAGDGNGFDAMMRNPNGLTAAYGLGPSTMSMVSDSGGGSFALEFANQALAFNLDLRDGVVGYDVTTRGNAFSVLTGGLPPLSGSAEVADFGLRMPLVQTDTPRDMGLTLRIGQVALDETVWAIFDPGQALPRDPADLSVDLAAKGAWTADLMDPRSMAEADAAGAMPIDMDSATLTSLVLDALGARIEAQGEVEFQQADDAPVPVPVGAVSVSAQGVQGLIEKLQVAGLLPIQFGTMATVMLGTYAVPAEGADSYTSQIEFEQNGGITANGQPLR
ncbi:hypothetical protein ACP2AV_12020 [Aliiroseovarius sp. PTFE2010]|uniref:hypothetical protein n=1 Tax=Aliiroseovarius sp. PTFE2010 TaxID=3417190 RepID=UPI003CEF3527